VDVAKKIHAGPGLGFLLVQAVRAQDYPLMQGLFLTVTLSVLAANLLVDVVAVLLDPRVRGREGQR
jgi:peptide/nickel transport system permease protein